MREARAIGRRLMAAAVTLPVPLHALAQAPTAPQPGPPGGVSSAWPLGIIVVLVAIVAVAGAWFARRRGGAAPGGPPRR